MKPNSARTNTKLVLLDQGLMSAGNFLFALALARLLGPGEYGVYALANSAVLFWMGIQTALIISPMYMIGPKQDGLNSAAYYRALMRAQLYFSIAVALFTILAANWKPVLTRFGITPELGAALGSAVLFVLIQEFLRKRAFALERADRSLVFDVLNLSIRFGLLALIWWLQYLDAAAALLAVMTACAVAAIWQGVSARSSGGQEQCAGLWSLRDVWLSHWGIGGWLVATSIVYWLGSQLVIFMTAATLSVSEVGAMMAALNLVGIVNVLFLAFENLAQPRAARIYRDHGIEGLNGYLRKIAMLGGGCSLVVLASIAGMAPLGFSLIFGQAYSGYEWLVMAWAIYYFVGFWQRPLSTGLKVIGQSRRIFAASGSGAMAAIVLAYPALKLAGLVGAMATIGLVQLVIVMGLLSAYRGQARFAQTRGLAANAPIAQE